MDSNGTVNGLVTELCDHGNQRQASTEVEHRLLMEYFVPCTIFPNM